MDSTRPDSDRLDDEEHWHRLLSGVPRRVPPVEFTARLMTASRVAWPSPRRRRVAGVQPEVAVTAGVVTGAALLTLLPVGIVALFFLLDAGAIVAGLARVFVMTVDWLSAGMSVWDVLGRTGRLVGAAIASPTGTAVMVAGFLTASLALAALNRLLPNERGEL